MLWVILISVLLLGLAFLIRHLVDEVVEVRYTFFVIIGVFLILYVGAAIFISYNLKSINANTIGSATPGQSSSYAKVEDVQPVDLTTGP